MPSASGPPRVAQPGADLPSRPAHVTPRPLSGLARLLGVKMTSPAEQEPFTGPEGAARLTGVTHDSRQVRPGDLYAALPGSHTHGARFCRDAEAAGAVAVLTDPGGRDTAVNCALPVFVVSDVRARLGEVAAWIYGHPSQRLLLLGVTGTSGKTTTSYLLESGLRMAGHVTGLAGGVETRAGQFTAASQLTTPEATDLQALFAVMLEQDVSAAAMEVSSHALALGRVAGSVFDVAIFTNLSQDHLDFHADMDDYQVMRATLQTLKIPPNYAQPPHVRLTAP